MKKWMMLYSNDQLYQVLFNLGFQPVMSSDEQDNQNNYFFQRIPLHSIVQFAKKSGSLSGVTNNEVIDGIKKTLGNYKDEDLLDDGDFRKIYDKNNNAYYFRTWLKAEFTIESGKEFID